MAGLDGKNPVLARTLGAQRGRCCAARVAYVSVRAGVLLGNLSVGRNAGHCGMAGQKKQEEPLHLFTGKVCAAVFRIGSVCGGHDSRRGFARRVACSLQFVWKDSQQLVFSRLRMGKQCAGLLCRARRQLCFL